MVTNTKKVNDNPKNTLKLHHTILTTVILKSYTKINYNNLKIYETLHIKTNPNTINLKTEANSLGNFYDNMTHQTKQKTNIMTIPNAKTYNKNNISPAPVTTNLNTLPTSVL